MSLPHVFTSHMVVIVHHVAGKDMVAVSRPSQPLSGLQLSRHSGRAQQAVKVNFKGSHDIALSLIESKRQRGNLHRAP
jgi:hypothetical protein